MFRAHIVYWLIVATLTNKVYYAGKTIINMVPGRAIALVLTIFFVLLMLAVSPEIMAAVQQSHVLDLDSPSLSFVESEFNDSSTIKEHNYTGAGNVTYEVQVPGNSTIISAQVKVTGKITYVYQSQVNTPGLLGASIGNITTDLGNEVVTGSTKTASSANVNALRGNNGTIIWTYNLSSPNNDRYSTAIGNITNYAGDEVVFGSEDDKVYVLNVDGSGATEAWNYTTLDDVTAVKIADIEDDGSANEVVAGSDKIYVLNSSGGLVCSSSAISVNDLAVGNLTSDSGLEIAIAASGGFVRVLNSSCDEVDSYNIGTGVNTIDVGNVTGMDYDEVVIGCVDNNVYLLNSTLDQEWSYTTNDDLKSVIIGDVVATSTGNEIVAGSNDKRVYTLNSSGGLIWDYLAESYIETVAVGNLTSDSGNEVAAGSGSGKIFVFNFDYFPTNLSLDVGNNGTYDWNNSGALRTSMNVTGIGPGFQYVLDNQCNGNGLCNVSMRFHSDNAGKLEVSELNVTYSYNVSTMVNYTTISSTWSRTSNVQVNESIGDEVKNVSFTGNPDQDVEVWYIKIPGASGECDFNGSAKSNVTMGADNTCDVTDFTVPASGSLPQSFHFWESSMSSAVPVLGNESGYGYSNSTDGYLGYKTLMVWNDTATVFTNVTWNTSIDDASVIGDYYLNVTWNGLTSIPMVQVGDAVISCDSSCSRSRGGYPGQ